jgi:hypothetical protein
MLARATMDTRYSFTAQFLSAGALQALDAYTIEGIAIERLQEVERTRHRTFWRAIQRFCTCSRRHRLTQAANLWRMPPCL